jgi:hypothetical protein
VYMLHSALEGVQLFASRAVYVGTKPRQAYKLHEITSMHERISKLVHTVSTF